MNLKRSVLAATAALSLALGAAPLTPAANATDVTPAQVADGTAVGEVKTWNVNEDPPLVVSTKKPQDWIKQVDNKSVLAYKVFSPSMKRDIPIAEFHRRAESAAAEPDHE